MCRPTTCTACGKTTWAGCGQHVEQVRRSVPANQWCDGRHPGAPQQSTVDGLLGRLLGR